MTVRILRGDVREVLPTLATDSVHCCVTSPPYWGLRSYLPADHPEKHKEIGSEPTLQEWVDTMVAVFREVRRVLRPDGVLFLNLGDAYVGNRGKEQGPTITGSKSRTSSYDGQVAQRVAVVASRRRDNVEIPRSDVRVAGLKPKDMMGQPWRVAFALQADGWYLRQEIIWNKPNPMPESVRDRCTKAHEHVFMLTKSEQYFYDFDAMQEPVTGGAHARKKSDTGVGFGHGYDEHAKPRSRYGDLTGQNSDGMHRTKAGLNAPKLGPKAEAGAAVGAAEAKASRMVDVTAGELLDTRNPRSVWTIPTHPFRGAHFATFPPELAARCVTAGCPPGGTTLDIFGGSGTVGLAADRQGKDAILIDLDERNVPMAESRIHGDAPLFTNVEVAA